MGLLLVEDSPRLQETIALGLRKAGYAVDVSSDGEDGLWRAREGTYDLVILDVRCARGFEAGGTTCAGSDRHYFDVTRDTGADALQARVSAELVAGRLRVTTLVPLRGAALEKRIAA